MSKSRKFLLLALLVPILAGGLILYFFNPAQSSLYPRCPFYQATGLLCPGCGSLRAMHQLIHGNIVAAFRFNALLMLLLPAAAWASLRAFVWQTTRRKQPAFFLSQKWLWVLLAAMMIFGVLRNLPQTRGWFAGP